MTPPRAMALGLLSCHACGLMCRDPEHGQARDETQATLQHCPRCGAAMESRKRGSLTRTWAYLIAAAILYIPANALPIMRTAKLTTGTEEDTILSGVEALWTAGAWDLALIVLVASIVVPVTKILVLSALALSVQRHARWQPRLRTRLYRIVERIGHWSMLDLFVAALLTALVRFHSLGQIEILPGAIAFGAVVVLTMLSAQSFDPRLIWDVEGAGMDTHDNDSP